MTAKDLFQLKSRPGPGLCPVKGCRRKLGKKKALCDAHHQQLWRARHPKDAAYANLKACAKSRGLTFSLTPDYFAGLTDAYAFFDHAAESRGEVLTIDRIDATKGYEPGNVRVVSLSENVIKGNRERYLPEYVQALLARKRAMSKEAWQMVEPDEPF